MRLCWRQEQPRPAGGLVELTFAYGASPVGSPAALVKLRVAISGHVTNRRHGQAHTCPHSMGTTGTFQE
jgi:hypothetical protein